MHVETAMRMRHARAMRTADLVFIMKGRRKKEDDRPHGSSMIDGNKSHIGKDVILWTHLYIT